jgi:BirA family biotin operon repressor/biotin-[acetyl-CoA-carboxylase] ligase
VSPDAEILAALRAAGSGSVSAFELARALGVSRAAVSARIADLRQLGFDIESSPHLGYRLRGAPDMLIADDLLSRIGKIAVVGRDIQVFKKTTSTNDIVEKLARDGVAEGVVVFAESQTKGRGRLGRKWISPTGAGLWFSILLRPDLRPTEATQLTVASATALRRAIAGHTGLNATIKWPNDVVVRGRKVAGILTELNAELDRVRYLVLGIGVNVNLAALDFPPDLRKTATSLSAECGRRISRSELAACILRELDRDYASITHGRFATVADEWAANSSTLGCQLVIRIGERRVRGRAESLDEEGALLLRTEHGHLERVTGGDVSPEKS